MYSFIHTTFREIWENYFHLSTMILFMYFLDSVSKSCVFGYCSMIYTFMKWTTWHVHGNKRKERKNIPHFFINHTKSIEYRHEIDFSKRKKTDSMKWENLGLEVQKHTSLYDNFRNIFFSSKLKLPVHCRKKKCLKNPFSEIWYFKE